MVCEPQWPSMAYWKFAATQEAYIVSMLLSYSRRYWRKALKRKTQTPIARRLIAVLKPHPRRVRPSCRKGNRKGQVWGAYRSDLCTPCASVKHTESLHTCCKGNLNRQRPLAMQYSFWEDTTDVHKCVHPLAR